jgi:hypothetical protein
MPYAPSGSNKKRRRKPSSTEGRSSCLPLFLFPSSILPHNYVLPQIQNNRIRKLEEVEKCGIP